MQMRACGLALRVAAGRPLAALRPLKMVPPFPAGRALPAAGLRSLIRICQVEGVLAFGKHPNVVSGVAMTSDRNVMNLYA